jgi:hypothetical protein
MPVWNRRDRNEGSARWGSFLAIIQAPDPHWIIGSAISFDRFSRSEEVLRLFAGFGRARAE